MDPLTIFTNLLASLTPQHQICDPTHQPDNNGNNQNSHHHFHQQRNHEDIQIEQQRNTILRAADFLFPLSLLEASLTVLDDPSSNIKHLRAIPSNRRIILVREYYCFIEKDQKINGSCGFYYCSCRSFYERMKRNMSHICKHILAVLMSPYLENGKGEEKQITEDEYVKYILQRK